MNPYVSLIIVGTVAVGVSAYFPFQVANKNLSLLATVFTSVFSLFFTYLITKTIVEKDYEQRMSLERNKYERKIRRLKKDYDTITLEKTIRDGTQTLIKNAVDYFKIENIKNEMGASAAIQNLQLDKYGQIIELLADFSLILPDYQENQQIVQQEIHHQIRIYEIDEKPFATFLRRILDKYMISVNKKMREKVDQNAVEGMKTCPRCAEKVLLKAQVCKHCSYEFKPAPVLTDMTSINPIERGKSLFRAGKYLESIQALTLAIDQNPNHASAYYARAIVYNKLGNYELAENDLIKASELGHKKAQELLKIKKRDR